MKDKILEALTLNKPRLLIIDDSERILSTLTEFLTQNGFDVVPVSNGLDGVKAPENNKGRFDLVITDIVIPDISGIGIISIVKERYKDIPVIRCNRVRNSASGPCSRGTGRYPYRKAV